MTAESASVSRSERVRAEDKSALFIIKAVFGGVKTRCDVIHTRARERERRRTNERTNAPVCVTVESVILLVGDVNRRRGRKRNGEE